MIKLRVLVPEEYGHRMRHDEIRPVCARTEVVVPLQTVMVVKAILQRDRRQLTPKELTFEVRRKEIKRLHQWRLIRQRSGCGEEEPHGRIRPEGKEERTDSSDRHHQDRERREDAPTDE